MRSCFQFRFNFAFKFNLRRYNQAAARGALFLPHPTPVGPGRTYLSSYIPSLTINTHNIPPI